MQIASLLLVTAFTAQAPSVAPSISLDAAQQPRQAPATVATNPGTNPNEPTHQFGLGAALTMTNRGVGASFRYWFGQHLGVTMQTSWYRTAGYQSYSTYGTSTTREAGNSFQVMPSLMILFGQTDATKTVSLRPYLGGGASYAYISRPGTTASYGPVTTTITGTKTSGVGEVGFAGIELSFQDYPSLTLSNEFAYYRLPVRLGNRAAVDGFNYQVAIHFYLK